MTICVVSLSLNLFGRFRNISRKWDLQCSNMMRCIGEHGIIINQNVWKNATVNDLVQDAEKDLNALI
jgi:hypothetical protein